MSHVLAVEGGNSDNGIPLWRGRTGNNADVFLGNMHSANRWKGTSHVIAVEGVDSGDGFLMGNFYFVIAR